MPKTTFDWLKAAVLLVVIALVGFGVSQRQAIRDQIKLARYTPPATIKQIAEDDTMTSSARHLFYINQPQLDNKPAFRNDCPNGSEKTIVLGCYKGNESGIYLLKVTDPRLGGVEQVTAAHEMLHAAYERLDDAEKAKISKLLKNYFETSASQRLKTTINAYKQSEPDQLVNEMHSIFGTEAVDLPKQLENYYKKYFKDRSQVTDYAVSYRSTFISLKQQVASLDATLESLKSKINRDEDRAAQLLSEIRAEQGRLESYRATNNARAYNNLVGPYNANVRSYNQLVENIKAEVNRYNQIVHKRNSLAVTINDLSQKLDASVGAVKPAS